MFLTNYVDIILLNGKGRLAQLPVSVVANKYRECASLEARDESQIVRAFSSVAR